MSEQMTDKDAIETLEIFRNDYVREGSAICRAIDIAIDALRQHTIGQRVLHGRWILCEDQHGVDNENNNYAYFCSQCHYQDVHSRYAKVNFCWNCGANMKMEDEDARTD